MFPSTYYSLFPAFPRNNKVFVAMSFDSRFDERYKAVIEPALRNVLIDGEKLDPYRIDARRISDSILTEILSGIRDSRLIFADVTTIERVAGRAIRNGNMMYEVGVAHAMRQPEEVLLFRSDDDEIPFDVANVRLGRYLPDDSAEAARALVTEAAISSLRELDLKKSLAIQRAAETLDNPSWMLLAEAQSGRNIDHPNTRIMGQVLGSVSRLNAIQRLLDIGAIKTSYLLVTPESYERMKTTTGNLLSYECTPFGAELVRKLLSCWKRSTVLKVTHELF